MIHRRQIAACGLSGSALRWRLKTGRLYAVHPLVFSLTPSLTEDGARAAALFATTGWLSRESVLWLHQVARREPDRQHVTILGEGRIDFSDIAVHRTRGFADGDTEIVRNTWMTTVGRALLDVAPHTSTYDLRRLVHEAQYRKLIDPLSLATILKTHPGHPGLKRLGAVDPAAKGTESGLERRLGRILSRVPGPPPARQHWVTGLSGRRYRADFAYVDAGLLLEADGRDAHARMLAFDEDRARDNDLLAAGLLLLRYTAGQMRTADRVLAEVDATLKLRRRV